MRTRVAQWGNSLAMRIPKSFAAELGLVAEGEVELTLEEGTLVVAPVAPYQVTLEKLLAGVTEKNLHSEVRTGPPLGDESW